MIDYSKHKLGSILQIHVCDDCQYRQTGLLFAPAESGGKSLWCEVCGHYNIGSTRKVQIGNWLRLDILEDQMQRADADREVPCSQIGHVQHSKTTNRDAVKKVISRRTLDRIYVEFGGYKR